MVLPRLPEWSVSSFHSSTWGPPVASFSLVCGPGHTLTALFLLSAVRALLLKAHPPVLFPLLGKSFSPNPCSLLPHPLHFCALWWHGLGLSLPTLVKILYHTPSLSPPHSAHLRPTLAAFLHCAPGCRPEPQLLLSWLGFCVLVTAQSLVPVEVLG